MLRDLICFAKTSHKKRLCGPIQVAPQTLFPPPIAKSVKCEMTMHATHHMWGSHTEKCASTVVKPWQVQRHSEGEEGRDAHLDQRIQQSLPMHRPNLRWGRAGESALNDHRQMRPALGFPDLKSTISTHSVEYELCDQGGNIERHSFCPN
jgi:hypothetical protein